MTEDASRDSIGDSPGDDSKGEPGGMNDILTLLEARDYLHTTTITLRNYIVKGLLPHEQTGGGTFLFRRADLDRIRPVLEENKARWKSEQGAQKRRKEHPE